MLTPIPLASRSSRIGALSEGEHDVLVVGGGITGCGLALDLAARGLSVGLVERGDWASATSSASSRLIHGGLRYLEQYEFGLVRESCLERGLLMRNAAGLVWPEQFVFPLHRGGPTGRLKLAAGLGLYTLVSVPRVLGIPGIFGAKGVQARVPGIRSQDLTGGGSYLDGATDDSRLALSVIATAVEKGVAAVSRCEMTGLEDGPSGVEAEVRDTLDGSAYAVRARSVVLCGGPYTEGLRGSAGLSGRWVQPTRGTHLTVPRAKLPTDGAVIFPSGVDGRIMFLIPWPRYTVIGTTDLDADPGQPVRATREEVRYLLDSANALVPDAGLVEDDVVSTWAGLRPLLAADADPSARSREERVEREGNVYTIAGGKLTGYRSMAEKLGQRLARELGRGNAARVSPTRDLRLRGALASPVGRPAWSAMESGVGDGPDALGAAWDKRYGSLRGEVHDVCMRAEGGLGQLDPETLLGEIDWAVRREDALTPVDFFLRRTDLGYGPLDQARAAAERVLERMAELQSWDARERSRFAGELEEALSGLHAWRSEERADRRVQSA